MQYYNIMTTVCNYCFQPLGGSTKYGIVHGKCHSFLCDKIDCYITKINEAERLEIPHDEDDAKLKKLLALKSRVTAELGIRSASAKYKASRSRYSNKKLKFQYWELANKEILCDEEREQMEVLGRILA